jgi:hypothetical protein
LRTRNSKLISGDLDSETKEETEKILKDRAEVKRMLKALIKYLEINT